MNIFYPFKNSSGKKNFPSFFKLFVTLLLCLAGVSVAQAEDWYLVGDFNGWNIADSNYKFVQGWHDDPNIYYLDVDFSNEGTIEYKVYESGSGKYYGDGVSRTKCFQPTNYTQETSNCVFTYNKGTYRFFINRNYGQCLVGCTGIIVNITEQTKNADGSVYIKATYTNANDGYQVPHGYEITYESLYGTQNKSSLSPVVGLGEEGGVDTVNNTFWYKLSKESADSANGNIYARVIDGQYGNSESTYYEYNPTPTTPTDLNLYVRGLNYNDWGYPGEEFKGITEDGILYIWDWAESPKEMSGPFKIAYCNIENPDDWNNDLNFGLENVATLTFGADGTWSGTLIATPTGDMKINPAKNVSKITFNYNTKELRIETETSSSCQNPNPGFTISGRLNAGEGSLWQGSAVDTDTSGSNSDKADGVFADDHRTITLTANSVGATYLYWECVGYAIDGDPVGTATIPDITWIGRDETSAQAKLSLPGTYAFVCKARCNEVDNWIESAHLIITAPAPEIGFDGPIGTPTSVADNGWSHTWAGLNDGGLLERKTGTLKWSRTFTYYDTNVNNEYAQFVVIQRYKLGCIDDSDTDPTYGWAGFTECGGSNGNKINAAKGGLQLVGIEQIDPTTNGNFRALDYVNWISGETQLTLTVTMTDYDSYKVELVEYQNTIAVATTEPADGSWGTVSMTAPDGITVIESGSNVADYVGQQITVTADPVEGYRVKKWVINGTEYVNSNTSYAPAVTEQGLNVVVYFERACNSVYVYEITGGGTICRNGGSTEITMNTLKNTSYQLYKDGDVCGKAVAGTGSKQVWKVTEGGTYTVKGYDTTYPECSSQAVDMTGEVVVTAVDKLDITLTPGSGIALSVLQTRTAKSDVPVDWEISVAVADGGGGDFCNDDNHYLIVSKDDLNIAYKVACLGKATLKATMKAPNDNCSFEATMDYNGTENEVCATIE